MNTDTNDRFETLDSSQLNKVAGGKKVNPGPPPAPSGPPGGNNILPGDGGPSTPGLE